MPVPPILQVATFVGDETYCDDLGHHLKGKDAQEQGVSDPDLPQPRGDPKVKGCPPKVSSTLG